MSLYLRHLWEALLGRTAARIAELEARVARADKRAAAQRKARASRATPSTTGATQ